MSVGELALLADARSSLERARSLSEVKAILDVAVAARKYAEAKKLGEESLAFAQEIVNRATRRMGEMLAETPRNPGVAVSKLDTQSQAATASPKLSDLGVSRSQSHRAQQIARIPDAVFEKAAAKPQNRLLRVAREAASEQRRQEPTDPQTVHGTVDIAFNARRSMRRSNLPAALLPLWVMASASANISPMRRTARLTINDLAKLHTARPPTCGPRFAI